MKEISCTPSFLYVGHMQITEAEEDEWQGERQKNREANWILKDIYYLKCQL